MSIWLGGLIQLLGLVWMGVVAISQPEDLETGDQYSADVESLSAAICPQFVDIERILDPVLSRREEGEIHMGTGDAWERFKLSLKSCVSGLQNVPCFSNIDLSSIISLESNRKAVEAMITSTIPLEVGKNHRLHEVACCTVLLGMENRLLGVTAELTVLQSAVNLNELIEDLTFCKSTIDELLK